MSTKYSGALNMPFYSSDLGKDLTIREYLHELLKTLWEEGEGFSGKRPFGNSGWKYDIENALVIGGFLEGEIYDDEDSDCIEAHCTDPNSDKFILGMIREMCGMLPK